MDIKYTENHDIIYLRNELLLRITLQNITLILNGLVFVISCFLQIYSPNRSALIGMTYIFFSVLLSAMWCHHGARQMQIKSYLIVQEGRFAIENSWESWLPRHPVGGLLGARWFISTKAPLICTATVTCVLGALLDTTELALPATVLSLCGVAVSSIILLTNPKEGLEAPSLVHHDTPTSAAG